MTARNIYQNQYFGIATDVTIIASNVWETDNHVHKLTTDTLRSVHVLVSQLEQFVNTKVSQSNVATRLRCGGIFSIVPLSNHC